MLLNVHDVAPSGGVHVTVAELSAGLLATTTAGLTLIGTTVIVAVPAEAPKAQVAANVTPFTPSSAAVVWYVATYCVYGLVAGSLSWESGVNVP